MIQIRDISQKLRQHLSSDRVFYQGKAGVEELEVEGHGNLWIVGRQCCLFRTIDLSSVPESRRDQALAAQMTVLSPFANPGYWVVWQADVARCWLWDEAERAAAAQLAAPGSTDVNALITLVNAVNNVVPESIFTSSAEADQVYLYESPGGGVFAHVWKDGTLIGDKFWSSPPEATDWSGF